MSYSPNLSVFVTRVIFDHVCGSGLSTLISCVCSCETDPVPSPSSAANEILVKLNAMVTTAARTRTSNRFSPFLLFSLLIVNTSILVLQLQEWQLAVFRNISLRNSEDPVVLRPGLTAGLPFTFDCI